MEQYLEEEYLTEVLEKLIHSRRVELLHIYINTPNKKVYENYKSSNDTACRTESIGKFDK